LDNEQTRLEEIRKNEKAENETQACGLGSQQGGGTGELTITRIKSEGKRPAPESRMRIHWTSSDCVTFPGGAPHGWSLHGNRRVPQKQ